MRFSGSRRARGIILSLVALLAFGLWRASQNYLNRTLRAVGPSLIAELERRLQRKITVERLVLDRPGHLLAEGVHVSQGEEASSGTFLQARAVEVRYNPALLAWSTLWHRGAGLDQRARLHIAGLRVNRPNPLAVVSPVHLLRADTLTADFSLTPLLTGSGNVLKSIGRVEIGRPEFAAVRRADGTWDAAQYLKTPDLGFRGDIRATDSRIEIIDLDPGALPRPQRLRVGGEFTLRFAGTPLLRFAAHGRTLGGQPATFSASGTRDSKTERWFTTVSATAPSIPYWYRYFVKEDQGTQVLAGAARVTGVVWDDHPAPHSKPQFRLDMDIRNGAARIRHLKTPFEQFSGRISSQVDLLTLNGSATLGGIPVDLAGEVVDSDRGPASWTLRSQSAPLERIGRLFPELKLPRDLRISQPLTFRASLTGERGTWFAVGDVGTAALEFRELQAPAARATFRARFGSGRPPEVGGEFRLSEVKQQDARLTNLWGRFQWKDALIHASARFHGFGGSGRVNGWATLAEQPELYLTGDMRNVQLRALPRLSEDVDLGGVGGAEFIVSGKAEEPRISAYVRGTSLSVNGQPLDEVSARVRVEPETLVIETATVRDHRGSAAVSGWIGRNRELALEVSAQGLDLRTLLRRQPEVSGRAFLQAHIGGTVAAPTARGHIRVYQPGLGKHNGDFLETAFTATSVDVQLSDLKLIRAPERVTAERVRLTRTDKRSPWWVDGELRVHGLSAPRAAQLAEVKPEELLQWPVAGDVQRLTIRAAGELAAPDISFEGTLSDAALRRVDLGSVTFSGAFDVGHRRLRLAGLEATSALGVLSAKGMVEFREGMGLEDARAEGSFRIRGLAIERMTALYQPQAGRYADVRGRADLSGSVSGSAAAPVVDFGDIRVQGLSVNGETVVLAPLRARLDGRALIVRGIEGRVRDGRLKVAYLGLMTPESGKEGSAPRVVVGPMLAENLPGAVLLGLLEASPALTDAQREWLSLFDRWGRRTGGFGARLSDARNGPDATDPVIAARLAGQAPEAELAGELNWIGVEPAEGLGEPADLRARFSFRPGRLEVGELTIRQAGGLQLDAHGHSARSPGMPDQLAYSARIEGLDLGLLDQLPDAGLRERLHPLQPLAGTLSFGAELTGTSKLPALKLTAAEVIDPVLAGIPLDRAALNEAFFSSADRRLRVGGGLLAKRPSPGAPEATVRVSGTVPLTWPEMGIPAELPRDLVVELPRQPLAVLNALAADAERLARTVSFDSPAGRERFTHLFGQVLAPEGTIEGSVRLAGTANQPDNSGSLTVASAGVRIRGMGSVLNGPGWHLPGWLADEIARSEPLQTAVQDFRMRVELAGETVRLAEFSGKSSHGGGFSGGGRVTLGRDVNGGPSARLDLRLALDGFRINERDSSRALGPGYEGSPLKATLTSVSPVPGGAARALRITGDWPSVTVSGGVRLDEASLPLAFDAPTSGERVPLPDNIGLALTVLPGKDVWLRNPVVRLRLEPPVLQAGRPDGLLTIGNRLTSPVVQGTLRAANGVFNLPLIRLRNAEGLIRVTYDGRSEALDVPGPLPVYVDLTAESTLRIQRSPAVEAEYYDATFEIRGSPGAGGAAGIRTTGIETGLAIGAEGGLTVTVRTDPPLPSGQIEALIRQQYVAEGFGTSGVNVVETLRGQIEQAFAVNVASELTGRVEDFVRSALGLSIFSVDFGVSQPLRVRLGKRLFGPVFATVSQSFGGAETQVQRRYELYYRVSPQLRVGYRQEDPLGRKVFFISGTASF